MIRAIIIEPNRAPRVEYIKNTPDTLRELVGGDVYTTLLDTDAMCHISDEAQMQGREPNRWLFGGKLVACGTMVITGREVPKEQVGLKTPKNPVSLTDKQVARYLQEFATPIHNPNDPEVVKELEPTLRMAANKLDIHKVFDLS